MHPSPAGGQLQLPAFQWNHQLVKRHHHFALTLVNVKRELDGLTTGPLQGQITDKRGVRVVHIIHFNSYLFLAVAHHAVERRAVCRFDMDREDRRLVSHAQGPLEEERASIGTNFELHIVEFTAQFKRKGRRVAVKVGGRLRHV